MSPPSNLDHAAPEAPNVASVHFGIGSPRLSLASNTYDNALTHEAADLLLVKYPGSACRAATDGMRRA